MRVEELTAQLHLPILQPTAEPTSAKDLANCRTQGPVLSGTSSMVEIKLRRCSADDSSSATQYL